MVIMSGIISLGTRVDYEMCINCFWLHLCILVNLCADLSVANVNNVFNNGFFFKTWTQYREICVTNCKKNKKENIMFVLFKIQEVNDPRFWEACETAKLRKLKIHPFFFWETQQILALRNDLICIIMLISLYLQ